MTLEDWGNLGEIIGALGIIVSLFAISYQMRRNTQAIVQSNREVAVDRTIEVNRLIASNPEVADVWRRGLANFDDLTQQEQTQLAALLMSVFVDYAEQYYKYKNGIVESWIWEAELSVMSFLMTRKGVISWWRTGKLGLPTEFANWVDTEIVN